jgi:hypothetical protein
MMLLINAMLFYCINIEIYDHKDIELRAPHV